MVIRLWRLKAIWSFVCLATFMSLYFTTQRLELRPSRPVPVTPIDHWISFDPRWTIVYESLWLLLPIGPWLATERWQVRRYVVGFALICVVAFPVFLLWPVDGPRPEVIPDATMYRVLVTIDGERNTIPSLHAALGLYSLLVTRRVLRASLSSGRLAWLTLAGVVWLAAILYATLATAQHWFIDLPPGLLLGTMAYAIAWRSGDDVSEGAHRCVPSYLP